MMNEFEAPIAVLKRAFPLKELPRVGWIMEGATRSEADSIGAHSYMVVLTSLLLTRQLEKSFGPFEREKVLTMATLHDLAECVTGDIDSGLKRRIAAKLNQRGIIEQIEQEALSALVADISDSDSLLKNFAGVC